MTCIPTLMTLHISSTTSYVKATFVCYAQLLCVTRNFCVLLATFVCYSQLLCVTRNFCVLLADFLVFRIYK